MKDSIEWSTSPKREREKGEWQKKKPRKKGKREEEMSPLEFKKNRPIIKNLQKAEKCHARRCHYDDYFRDGMWKGNQRQSSTC